MKKRKLPLHMLVEVLELPVDNSIVGIYDLLMGGSDSRNKGGRIVFINERTWNWYFTSEKEAPNVVKNLMDGVDLNGLFDRVHFRVHMRLLKSEEDALEEWDSEKKGTFLNMKRQLVYRREGVANRPYAFAKNVFQCMQDMVDKCEYIHPWKPSTLPFWESGCYFYCLLKWGQDEIKQVRVSVEGDQDGRLPMSEMEQWALYEIVSEAMV